MTLLNRLFRRPTGIRPDGPWVATHRHRKGGLYRLIDQGINEADRAPVAIYDDPEGTIWVRSRAEFEDGRFTAV